VSILLYRIDDRLVHGQVLIGWGQPLGIRRLLLVDDDIRAAEWEQDLYRSALPQGMDIVFATTEEALDALPRWDAEAARSLLVTGSVATMAALATRHPDFVRTVNLGGIHHQPGRSERLPYVYLSPEEYHDLVQLQAAGVRVTAQDIPRGAEVALRSLG